MKVRPPSIVYARHYWHADFKLLGPRTWSVVFIVSVFSDLALNANIFKIVESLHSWNKLERICLRYWELPTEPLEKNPA